eukprot:g7279.t1
MSIAPERLVLSEVHVGSSTLDEEEVVSRYTYLTPPSRWDTNTETRSPAAQDARATGNADDCSSDEDNSSSSGGESEEGSYSRVTRHRKRLRTSSQRRRPAHEVLTVVHRMATTLGLVGQQVWSAAFLLGDFVLTHEDLFAGMQVLELGAGPGVVGLVAARVAKRCYLTDYHHEVLKLLARNAEANKHLFAVGGLPTPATASATSADNSSDGDGGGGDSAAESGTTCGRGEGGCVVAIRELDWFTFSRGEGSAFAANGDPGAEEGEDGDEQSENDESVAQQNKSSKGNGSGACRPFSWRKDELEGLSLSTSLGGGLVLVAADVIYDEGLTDAFFHVLRMLMPIPLPPVPAGENGENTVPGDCKSSNVTSAPKAANRRSSVDETPPFSSASGDSVGSESAATGKESKGDADERAFCCAEGKAQAAVLYLALEKRFNFSMAELSVAATGYSALLRNVLDVTQQADDGGAGEDGSAKQAHDAEKCFEGRRLPLTFQQCFRYQRSDAMELWEIRRRPLTRPKT